MCRHFGPRQRDGCRHSPVRRTMASLCSRTVTPAHGRSEIQRVDFLRHGLLHRQVDLPALGPTFERLQVMHIGKDVVSGAARRRRPSGAPQWPQTRHNAGHHLVAGLGTLALRHGGAVRRGRVMPSPRLYFMRASGEGSRGTSIARRVLGFVLARAKSSYCKKNELDPRERRGLPLELEVLSRWGSARGARRRG